jgi:redox-sensitive bicupin YhaK (pirin superfamily)
MPATQLIGSDQFYRVGQAEFGVPGLIAIESFGPFVRNQHVGPFVMIHDGFFQPGFGIGHHPHRYHERLFYILNGRVEHDDSLNNITGTMNEGDLGRLTEGVRGMLHREWNGADGQVTRAFILVYRPDTEPEIPVASFGVLRATDRPSYPEGSGVRTLELIGERSDFKVNLSTFRRYLDTSLDPAAELELALEKGEIGLVYPVEGSVDLTGPDGAAAGKPQTLRAHGSRHPEGPAGVAVLDATDSAGSWRVTAADSPARLLRIVVAA